MSQIFYTDVANIDLVVFEVARFPHSCCKCFIWFLHFLLRNLEYSMQHEIYIAARFFPSSVMDR